MKPHQHLLGVWLVISCGLLAPCRAAAPPGLPPVPVEVHSPKDVPCDCGQSGVVLSPDGRSFLLYPESLQSAWRASLGLRAYRRERSIVDTACFEEKGDITECSIATLRTRNPFNGAGWWSADSRTLFLPMLDDHLGALRLADTRLHAEPHGLSRRMQTWFGDLLRVVGPTPANSSEAEARRIAAAADWRRRIDAASDRRTDFARYKVTLHADGMTASGRLRNSIAFAVLTDPQRQHPEKTGFSSMAFGAEPMADLLPGADGNWWVVRGAVARRNGAHADGARWDLGPAPSPFGQRPVMQADTGRLIGLHTESTVKWLAPSAKREKLDAQLRDMTTGGYVLHSLQLAADDMVAFALLSHAGRGGLYVLFRWDQAKRAWMRTLQDCASTENRFDFDAQTLNVGTARWPVPARWYQRAGARRLVVFLHGGPASTAQWDGALGAHPYRHLPPGQDLITFDVSGAAGGSAHVADRLRAGPRALTRDIGYINAFLRRMAARYEHVSLLAVSFGGVIAPGVIKGLDARLDRIALVVPYAKVRSPTELKTHFENPRSSFAMLFHREYMGADESFARWLSQQYAGLAVDERYALVFAQRDDSSRPEDIPAFARAGYREMFGGGHDLAGLNTPFCWLNRTCDVLPAPP